jgi:hypothetical protein
MRSANQHASCSTAKTDAQPTLSQIPFFMSGVRRKLFIHVCMGHARLAMNKKKDYLSPIQDAIEQVLRAEGRRFESGPAHQQS